jgi:hypothetical protein
MASAGNIVVNEFNFTFEICMVTCYTVHQLVQVILKPKTSNLLELYMCHEKSICLTCYESQTLF